MTEQEDQRERFGEGVERKKEEAAVRLHHVLFYDYVENIVERRAPHRPHHLELVERWREDGRFVMGGAIGDPPQGALLVFRVDDPAEVEAFVAQDPYVQNGLVTAHRVEPWAVV